MFIMQKITTAFRGAARENAERFIDANAIRIFEQEIFECEQAITLAKRDLAKVVAEKKQLERALSKRNQGIRERESQIEAALGKDMESLAEDVANWIVEQEKVAEEEKRAILRLSEHESKLRASLSTAAKRITHYRRELRMVVATQNSQQATAALKTRASTMGSKLMDMQDSLDRIRRNQEQFDDVEEALFEVEGDLEGASLDDKLKNAGIGKAGEAKSVLERVRAKMNEE